MIILTNEILENNSKFNEMIEKEKNLISLSITLQKKTKDLLLDAMQRFANSTTTVNPNTSDTIIKLLNDFKISLDLSNTNIVALENLINKFDSITNLNNINEDVISENINNLNITYLETNESVLSNTLQIEQTLNSALSFSEFVFSDNTETNLATTAKEENIHSINDVEKKSETDTDTKLIKPINNTNIIENTLIISELKGKVFLPYTLSCLNNILNDNPDKYSSIEDIIEKEYTIPYELFKSPAISRFKEAFKLVRYKNKGSIKEAFDLGMELLFNYNLHPAIISACRNLDELDIYLDYLEDNETDKFNCFDIKFEIAPKLVQ